MKLCIIIFTQFLIPSRLKNQNIHQMERCLLVELVYISLIALNGELL